MELLNINKLNYEYDLIINPEQPYLEIISVEFENEEHSLENFSIMCYETTKKSSSGHPIHSYDLIGETLQIDVSDIDRVYLKIEHIDSNIKCNCTVKYKNLRLIDTNECLNEFNEFISLSRNTKILFTAPFGHGKSTFLDIYFENNLEEYNVYKIHPINYSVSSNKDIFRYIKVDLLFQLLSSSKELNFSEDSISFQHALSEVLIEDYKIVFKNMLKIGLSINPKTSFLSDTIEPFFRFIKQIKTKRENNLDQMRIKSFMEEIYKEEGSIYDDNLYTQLIKLFLAQIKNQKNKKSVLIIEDLDRIDPEHIFRILNVISAHFDDYIYNDNINYNKFGFDKIIIVCDINNIQELFKHRFGIKSDFIGYMNKFYSTKPFHFDNKKMMTQLIDNIISVNSRLNREEWLASIREVFNLLINGEQISARDLIKVSHFNFNSSIEEIRETLTIEYHSNKGLYMPIINMLLNMFGDELISKIEICKLKGIEINRINLHNMCSNLLAPLGKEITKDSHLKYSYNLDGVQIEYSLKNVRWITDIIISDMKTRDKINFKFSNSDCYNLLIENVKQVIRLKQ